MPDYRAGLPYEHPSSGPLRPAPHFPDRIATPREHPTGISLLRFNIEQRERLKEGFLIAIFVYVRRRFYVRRWIFIHGGGFSKRLFVSTSMAAVMRPRQAAKFAQTIRALALLLRASPALYALVQVTLDRVGFQQTMLG